jgi:hypothetical protein
VFVIVREHGDEALAQTWGWSQARLRLRPLAHQPRHRLLVVDDDKLLAGASLPISSFK